MMWTILIRNALILLYYCNACNYFIATGDFNTCFSRDNAHTKSVNTFFNRNNFEISCDPPLSIKDFTYNNLSLNHFSYSDHCIVTNNVYDSIINSNVVFYIPNPSNHNIIYMSFDFTVNFKSALAFNNNNVNSRLLWSKET